jgi:D-alanine-D-alanine ligase
VRVAILYNDDRHLKPQLNPIELRGEEEVGQSAADIEQTLQAGHQCRRIALRDSIGDAIGRLEEFSPQVVVHLCEGALGRSEWEPNVTLLLEMLGLPHTGCDPIGAALCHDKGRVKALLRDGGVSTPPGVVIESAGDFAARRSAVETLVERFGRVIVKPVHEDGGIGIDATSVADSADGALGVARELIATLRQPALIEAFIDGAEFNQAIYWNGTAAVLLPAGEVVFDASLTPAERVVGWKAKWDAGSREDRATVSRTPAQIDDRLRQAIGQTCLRAARLLDLTSYCRFDLRQDEAGALHVIDINPNPDIGPDSGFRRALAAAGISFRDFLEQLMMTAAQARQPSSGP